MRGVLTMKNKKLFLIFILISIFYIFSGCETKSNEDLLIISSPYNNNNKIVNY